MHAGDLPRYKGNACPNWAIINDEDNVVLTIHQMDEGLDSGPIFYQSKFKLDNDTYIGEIYTWLSTEVPKLFVATLTAISNGGISVAQSGRALRTFPRKPEDSQLDFTKDIKWNYRLIRASSKPFYGAFCYLNNGEDKVTIWHAKPLPLDFDFFAISGQVIDRNFDENTFTVAICNEALHVSDFSINGLNKDESFNLICSSMRNRLT